MIDYLEKHYDSAKLTMKPNFMLIPVTEIPATREGMEEWNKIYHWVINQGLNPIVRTKSGGISIKKGNLRLPCYDVTRTKSCVTITLLYHRMWRITFRYKPKTNNEEEHESKKYFNWWKLYKDTCEKFGIDLNSMKIDNGKEIKKEVPKPLIKVEHKLDINRTFNNCHHIDFHSSYPAGLINTHPEFEPVERYLYNKRKQNEKYKLALNASIGKFHSELVSYSWANLARDAIQDNNNRLIEMARRLKDSGRTVLLYNTDGVWYRGEIYHGEGEGDDIGQWRNDHTNCTLRIKSPGAYEYIESGKYYPVLRGMTDYDYVKQRTEWEWGDIYREDAQPLKFAYNSKNGIYIQREGEQKVYE